MTLRTRILLMVSGLLALAVLAAALTLAWTARQSLIAQAEADGQLLAQLLARSASFALRVPPDVEDAIGDQMIVEATIAAHLVAIAEAAGLSPEEINAHLRQITEDSPLDEFWITDESGHAYLRNIAEIDFTFDPDPRQQPQAHVFWPLLTGEQQVVKQEARVREVDDQAFKYVGVAGVDRPRIVQVGYNVRFLEELRRQLGLTSLTKSLVSAGDVVAIRVLDKNYSMLAYDGAPGSPVSMEIDPTSLPFLEQAIQAGQTVSYMQDELLVVIAPIIDLQGQVLGAVMVYLSTEHVQATLQRQVRLTIIVAGLVLALGLLFSMILARRVTGPVARLTGAAAAVEAGNYESESLESVAGRQDELGRLARVFTRMARQVQAREQQLRQQVEALRIEIDTAKTQRQVAEITESEYFRQLQERVRLLRSRSASSKSESQDD
ncbi:MAG: HAMP domain-containing protein [Anaerolineales bacterium]|nr:HAMP domain-containing protein [Anaerolineales bacterium]